MARARRPRHPVLAAGITGTIPSVGAAAGVDRAPAATGCVVVPGARSDASTSAGWEAVGAEPSAIRPEAPARGAGGRPRRGAPMAARRAARRHPRVELWSQVLRPAATTEAWRHELSLRPDGHGRAHRRRGARPRRRGGPDRPAHARRRWRRRASAPSWSRPAGSSAGASRPSCCAGASGSTTAPACRSTSRRPASSCCSRRIWSPSEAAPVRPARGPEASAGQRRDRAGRASAATCARWSAALLRGPRLAGGLDGLVAALRELRPRCTAGRRRCRRPSCCAWLERLADGGAAVRAPCWRRRGAAFRALLEAHLAFAEWLAADERGDAGELWAQGGRRAARTSSSASSTVAGDVAGPVPTSAYPALLAVLLGAHRCARARPPHPRLAILGQLESRLVQADLVLIGGLNEGACAACGRFRPLAQPRHAPAARAAAGRAGAWASPRTTSSTSVCAPEVVLSRAAKDERGAPTTPSRWLARLEAVLTAAGGRDRVRPPAQLGRLGGRVSTRRPARPGRRPAPEPRPPLAARPRELWATDIERLMRDPYAVYARRILMLAPLEPLDADPGGAERGQIIHAALEEFVRDWPGAAARGPLRRADPDRAAPFRPAGAPAAGLGGVVAAVRADRGLVLRGRAAAARARSRGSCTEIRGTLELDGPGGAVPHPRPRRPDRDRPRRPPGRSSTTRPAPLPRNADVASGLSPQLTIEALIAESGGFAARAGGRGGAAAVPAAQGRRSRRRRGAPSGRRATCAALLAEARVGLARLVAHFDDPATPYVPVPRPEIAPAFSDYEHLARNGEWWGTEADRRERSRARRPRRSAAPPTRAASVWVTANAGTGKTRVLSDRVLRLLLDGTEPEGILCLTFTKAAAAEMTGRIEERLAAWATTADDAALAPGAAGAHRRARRPGAARPGAAAVRAGAGAAARAGHHDHPRAVRRPAAPVPARGRRGAAFRDHRRAQRGRADAGGPRARRCAPGSDPGDAARPGAAGPGRDADREHASPRRWPSCWASACGCCAAGPRSGAISRRCSAAIHRALGAEPGQEPAAMEAQACADGRYDAAGLLAAAGALAQGSAKDAERGGRPSPPGWLRHRTTGCDCSPSIGAAS